MKNLLTFALGATVGAVVSWIYHKNKYEEIIQEEIESLREHSREVKCKNEDNRTDDDVVETEDVGEEKIKAEKIINYSGYSRHNEVVEDETVDKYKKPFIITPEAFATMAGFDTDTFYYYNDDVIANGAQEKIDDVEFMFGMPIEEIKKQFGVYEDHAVYFRNMQLECDYEILIEEENFYKEE